MMLKFAHGPQVPNQPRNTLPTSEGSYVKPIMLTGWLIV
jgi:hypothetical protein